MKGRSRRRPRRDSCAFRSLWFTVKREAFLLVWSRELGRNPHSSVRRQILDTRVDELQRRAKLILRRWPTRRVYP